MAKTDKKTIYNLYWTSDPDHLGFRYTQEEEDATPPSWARGKPHARITTVQGYYQVLDRIERRTRIISAVALVGPGRVCVDPAHLPDAHPFGYLRRCMATANNPNTPPLGLAALILDEMASDEAKEDARANPNFDPLAVVYLQNLQSGYSESMSWDEFKAAALDTPSVSR
jgi:hypothetical protein